MGVHVIRIPDIGEGVAEVELVTWHVQPGERVREDQPLAEVMTDKATVEIPSPVAGQVLALGGALGQALAVGAELIRIEVEGAGNAATVATAEPIQTQPPPVSMPAPPPSPIDFEPAPMPGPAPSSTLPLAAPAVRQRARQLGIDLRTMSGSGPEGRITHADLDRLGARAGPGYAERHDESAVPVIGLRRKIAQKMQQSKRHIPHFTYVEEIDMSELETLRQRLNQVHGAAHGRLTILPFLVRALVLAVREFPQINARFDDDAGIVTRYGALHVGIATQTEAGLLVPVLRHAEARDLWGCAAEIARLAEAARCGQATRSELAGSTITLSSLGALGGVVSTPVINHPEVAIIGVNRMRLMPVIRDGAVVARQMMNLSSSFDHRVVDGLHAAQFIHALRGLLECPAMLFLEPATGR